MAINETISIGNKYRRLKDTTNMIWQRLSFWTHASDVEFSDDSNLNDNMTANSNVFNFVYSNGNLFEQWNKILDGGGDTFLQPLIVVMVDDVLQLNGKFLCNVDDVQNFWLQFFYVFLVKML